MKKALLILTLLLSNPIAKADLVRLRGSEGITHEGVISSGSHNGLRFVIDDSVDGTVVFPWSQVHSFESSNPRPTLIEFQKAAELLWRAKERLERGDVLLAEPLFKEIFANKKYTASHDARLAAEGYLRCLIARGALLDAVEPWLAIAVLESQGFASPFSQFDSVIDAETLLCPFLPPVWAGEVSLVSVYDNYLDTEHPRVASIVSGLRSIPNQQESATQAVLSFLNKIFTIEDLSYSAEDSSSWKQIWFNYFKGIVEIETNDLASRNQGLLKLSRVAALGKGSQQWLAGAAMLRLSDELMKDGESKPALQISEYAKRRYPAHPLHKSNLFNIRNFSP